MFKNQRHIFRTLQIHQFSLAFPLAVNLNSISETLHTSCFARSLKSKFDFVIEIKFNYVMKSNKISTNNNTHII